MVGYVSVVVFVVAAAVVVMVVRSSVMSKELLGLDLVRCLYEYDALEEFGTNAVRLKDFVSEEVFDRLSSDNSDRVLSVYLKFNAKPCQVNVIDSTQNYVVYSLISSVIEPERVFAMFFDVDGGKVIDVREAELFAFPTTIGFEVNLNKLPAVRGSF
jgi:hypothetical protein